MKNKVLFYYFILILLVTVIIISVLFLSWSLFFVLPGIGGSITLGGLFTYFFINIPHFQKILSYIARAFSYFRFAELASVKYNIEGNLNSFKETANLEVKNIMPYGAEVKWVQELDLESFIDEYNGKVVIRMRHHRNQAQNIAYAALTYVSKGLIRESRLYLDRKMSKAIDFTMGKRMLLEQNQKSALDYFLSEVVSKEIDDTELNNYVTVMENLSQEGIFTRIFLYEIRELGRTLYPKYDENARTDIKSFFGYLDKFSKRKKGDEELELSHKGDRIRIAFILIAKPEKILFEGTEPYVRHAERLITKGINSLYCLARGVNVPFAKTVVQDIERIPGIEKVEDSDEEFNVIMNGKKVKRICATFNVKGKAAPIPPPLQFGKKEAGEGHLEAREETKTEEFARGKDSMKGTWAWRRPGFPKPWRKKKKRKKKRF